MGVIYGPVSSWRLKRSLGVDLICREDEKVCSFGCVYCSLGKTTEKTVERRVFVPTEQIEKELREEIDKVEPDVITMSGTGEPTLAKNIGETIEISREVTDLPVSVLTNSSLMMRKDVRKDLEGADIVVGSLDAPDQELFEKINRPYDEITFQDLVQGLKKFSEDFEGRFELEIMFIPDNLDFSEEIAEVAKSIEPDEVQINTPLRKCPVEPCTQGELEKVEKDFEGMEVRSVYQARKEKVEKVVGPEKLKKLKRTGGG